MFAVAAHPQMDGDALAFVENLDAADAQPRLDLHPGEAIWDRVIMRVDLDVIINPDATQTPFAIRVGLDWQRLQRRAVDLFKQLAAGGAHPAEKPLLVEVFQHLVNRGVEFSQAVKRPAAQPAEQPAFDNQHGGLDLCLIARLSGPRRQ